VLGGFLGRWPELERFVPRSYGSSRARLRPCPVDDRLSRREGGDSPICRLRVTEALEGRYRAVRAFAHRAWERAGGRQCAPLVSARVAAYTIPARSSAGPWLYGELGVHSRADAIARATALGLLEQTQSPM
jgi:hypothetical protein